MLIDIPPFFQEEQRMATDREPQFRNAIPQYAPPDREAWTAAHGHRPEPVCSTLATELTEHTKPNISVPSVPSVAKFLTRARAACGTDYGTLSFRAAIDAHSALETVNEALTWHLRHLGIIGSDTTAWFDPAEDCFYLYRE